MTKLLIWAEIMSKGRISEKEFARICRGLSEDRETIFKHNPIGSESEALLWMLMSVLISYLSLDESEIPCFPGKIGAETYHDAILLILKKRKDTNFDENKYLNELINKS